MEFIHNTLDNLKSYIYTSKIDGLRKVLLSKWRSLKLARIHAIKWDVCDLVHELKVEEA
jgi:hypothetical protein